MQNKTTLMIFGGLILFIGIVILSVYSLNHKTSLDPMPQSNNTQKYSNIKALAIRLAPFQDLRKSLDSLVNLHQIEAGCILSCAGSLRQAAIRFANQDEATFLNEKFEIVSLSGTLSKNGSHLHIAISDSTGKTIGGHLMEGCLIYTTAEIMIGILPELKFVREHDPKSGYRELVIYRK
ncbi:MAG: DNA-binding protein [candidate division KSB1 bacterium]|nr:DNA-binding protein [candidate division KSB1 bacterium]